VTSAEEEAVSDEKLEITVGSAFVRVVLPEIAITLLAVTRFQGNKLG
jgi:hypothetical protein